MTTANKSIIISGSAFTKSFRKSIAQAGESVNIPQKVNKLKVKNVGTVDVKIVFNNSAANYWTLKVGDKEDFDIGDGVVVDAAGVGGAGLIELVFS